MDRLLKINGSTYKAAEFDINFMCEMEDNGIGLDEIDKKMFKTIRMYVALSMGVDPEIAGKEITEHLRNGGKLDEISDVMSQMMQDSDFFRTEPKNKDQTSPARAKKKKAESEEVETEATI
jgi:hypothetical protein